MKRAQRRPGRPPGNTSDTTRANILRAARITFARKGFGVATNRDIADHAGVTSAAIYQYFDSKVTLYVEAAREAVAEVAANMRARTVSDGSAALAMSSMVQSLLALHETDPSLGAFLSVLPNELQRHPEIAERLSVYQTDLPAIMGGVVKRAIIAGELEAKDADRVAEMFIACLMGLAQYVALNGHAQAVSSAFSELLEGRLFARPAKPRPTAKPAAVTKKPLQRARRA